MSFDVIHIYIYICVCVCVRIFSLFFAWMNTCTCKIRTTFLRCRYQPINKQISLFLLLTNSFFNREREREKKRERKEKCREVCREIQWTTQENSIRVEGRSQLCITTTRKDKLRQKRSVDIQSIAYKNKRENYYLIIFILSSTQ